MDKVTLLCFIILMTTAWMPQCCGGSKYVEYFSSTYSLEMLGNIEMSLVDGLRQYVAIQEANIVGYCKFLQHIKDVHSTAALEARKADFLGDPINAFKLIKRMVADWSEVHAMIKDNFEGTAFKVFLEDIHEEVKWPNYADLSGAVRGLARIQDVYDLTADDLAHGIVNGEDYGSELSWYECYKIAASLYDAKNFTLAINWFEVTLDMMDKEETDDPRRDKLQIDVLDYLAFANYELGAVKEALEYLKDITEILPKHTAKDTLKFMRSIDPAKTGNFGSSTEPSWYKNYTRLCRGERVPEHHHHKLKCRIANKNVPYYVLAPLRIEELHLDPEISLYHGMLNEDQIENLLQQADGHMIRSIYRTQPDETRISQQAWLNYNTSVTRMIYSMISYVTGLDMRNSEIMQVANYGIGGHFNPHCDYLGPKFLPKGIWIGDRLASTMFFLSNVKDGGYTVFPRLNLAIPPQQGSLIVWYNMHKSLDQDFRAIHAGCPIVTGKKWIGNIWVHSGFQEFRRPCELRRDHYKSFNHDLC